MGNHVVYDGAVGAALLVDDINDRLTAGRGVDGGEVDGLQGSLRVT